jgi:hypothetical protein
MNKEEILVCKMKDKVVISYDGKRLIKNAIDFKDMSNEQIKEWFIKEMDGR